MDKRMIATRIAAFNQLSADDLYEILKLRSNVFVVEQNCVYPDLDEKDRHPQTMHVALKDKDEQLMAYARILPPNLSYPQPSIGRIVVDADYRNKGLARKIVQAAIELIQQHWPEQDIQIGAQEYLLAFYQSMGFENHSEMYLEDGIPHRDMLLRVKNIQA